jgi:hypothetical protein
MEENSVGSDSEEDEKKLSSMNLTALAAKKTPAYLKDSDYYFTKNQSKYTEEELEATDEDEPISKKLN